MAETVVVTVDPEGNVTVGAQGVKGAGCKQLTAAIEGAIGRTTEDVKTAEFFGAVGQAAVERMKAEG